jgi:broad specificity phosphatase PhoE
MLKISLIRHGQTDWNAQGRWQGAADIPLNAEGRAQALTAAPHLPTGQFDRIISSPLARARQTAELLNQPLCLPLEFDPRLVETNVGLTEGLTWAEIAAQHPAIKQHLEQTPYEDIAFPGGESRRQVADRMEAAIQDYLVRYAGQHLLLVSHGGSIRITVYRLLGIRPEVGIENCHLARLEATKSDDKWVWTLLGWNEKAEEITWSAST